MIKFKSNFIKVFEIFQFNCRYIFEKLEVPKTSLIYNYRLKCYLNSYEFCSPKISTLTQISRKRLNFGTENITNHIVYPKLKTLF